MITYAVLLPGDIPTGAAFASDSPDLEAAADALAAHYGYEDRDALVDAYPNLVIGFAPFH